MNTIESRIEDLLLLKFNPTVLNILNESYMHNVPEGAESHFKLVIVTDSFKDISIIKRHKAIYSALEDIIKSIHALSIHPFDEQEYKKYINFVTWSFFMYVFYSIY